LGPGQISISEIERIENELDEARKREREKGIKRELDFLNFVSKFMCQSGKVVFVQCNTGSGPDGKELKEWLGGVFGSDVDITLYEEGVKWFYGFPKTCSMKE
jgi:hypothetical protein